MIDHILGRPSPTLRRSQIFLVLFFWTWRLYKGDGAAAPGSIPTPSASGALPMASRRVGHRHGVGSGTTVKMKLWIEKLWVALVGRSKFGTGWIGRINHRLKNFTPYQLILGTFTLMYAIRHLDDLLGVGAPEPLARLYSRSYYRATYINTALDAGFASAMSIRPKWLKDLCSMLFSAYYLVWANEGDEVLRRFRALCTVEMLRVTWEKTRNPYIRLFTALQRPRLTIYREVLIMRPPSSSRANLPPVKGLLFFDGPEEAFARATEIVVDFPGGGFIAMGPDCHEERLRRWAKRTGKPVLGIDYGKAPEYPYPWAIEEGFDAYRTLMETRGSCIGIKSGKLSAVLTGDSAGGNICTTIVIRILEHHTAIPRPTSIILAYPALDFNFTSWMSPNNLRVLRTEQSENHIPGLRQGKDHMRHKSPLSVVDDVVHPHPRKNKQGEPSRLRQRSWGEALSSKLPSLSISPVEEKFKQNETGKGDRDSPPASAGGWASSIPLPRVMSQKLPGWLSERDTTDGEKIDGNGSDGSDSASDEDDDKTVKAFDSRREADKALRERVKTPRLEKQFDLTPLVLEDDAGSGPGEPIVRKRKKKTPIGTRLTMTSRVGYFQDRTISPSMMRAMAILYVGPRRNPDFETDYYISPMLAPPHILAYFPPVYFICGERDPFVDDTVIFAGKIREAKKSRRAQAEFAANGSGSKSARFGEGLRMSTSTSSSGTKPVIVDPILGETDEDWVQMRIIEGWGHGFMQMAALMKEVDKVLTEMADWIDESFERVEEKQAQHRQDEAAHAHAHALALQLQQQEQQQHQHQRDQQQPPSYHETENLVVPVSTHVKPVNVYQPGPTLHKPLGGADLGSAIGGDLNSDNDQFLSSAYAGADADDDKNEEGMISFTPKTRLSKKTPPPSKFLPVPRRASKEELKIRRSSSAPKFDMDEPGYTGEGHHVQAPPSAVISRGGLPLQETQGQSPSPAKGLGSGAFAFFGSSRANKVNTNTNTLTSGIAAPTRLIVPATGGYGSVSLTRPLASSSIAAPIPIAAGPGSNSKSTVNANTGNTNTNTNANGRRGSNDMATASRPTNSLVAAAVAGARAASPALAAAGLVPQSIGNVSEAELMRRRRLEAVYGMGETGSHGSGSGSGSDAEDEDEEEEEEEEEDQEGGLGSGRN